MRHGWSATRSTQIGTGTVSCLTLPVWKRISLWEVVRRRPFRLGGPRAGKKHSIARHGKSRNTLCQCIGAAVERLLASIAVTEERAVPQKYRTLLRARVALPAITPLFWVNGDASASASESGLLLVTPTLCLSFLHTAKGRCLGVECRRTVVQNVQCTVSPMILFTCQKNE